MKNNRLLLGTAVFTGALLFSAQLFLNNNTQKYIPTTDGEASMFGFAKDALGAQKWLFDIQKNPLTGKIEESDVLKAREEVALFYKNNSYSSRAPIGLEWTELGPDNVGGRTRGILIDKNDPNKMFACSVAGGLFKSTNKGSTWTKVNDAFDNMNMTCITQAPNGDIYIGTGEDLYNGLGNGTLGSGLLGGGIYKSTDGGNTFTLLTSTIPANPNSASNTGNPFIGVNNIATDPSNSNRIYAATRAGFQMSDDGGATWIYPAKTSGGIEIKTRATDVDVASDGTVIASIGDRLYLSANGNDNTFSSTTVGTGLPSSSTLSRIEFAIAPSDPNYMYALAGKSSNGLLEGVYQSIDKGVNWTKIGIGGSSQFECFGTGQAAYDNSIAVFPANKTKIIIGGVSMWSWKQTNPNVPGVGQWSLAASQLQSPFNPAYVHADIHTFKFDPTNPNVFWIGCDGGVFRGIDNGTSFLYQPMNNGYNVTQFYGIAYQSLGKNGTGVMGGTQDNGTNFIIGTGNTSMEAIEVNGGDGGECEFSHLNPNISFTSVYYGSLSRHSSLGGSPSSFYSSKITSLSGFGSPAFASFVTPVALYETKNATNTPDSVQFINGPQSQTIPPSATNGVTKKFQVTLSLPYSSATIVPDSIVITNGTGASLQTITDNGAGLLVGDIDGTGVNTVNYSTGVLDFTFATAPAAGTAIYISFDVKYNIGSNFTFSRPEYVDDLHVTSTTVINPGDTVNFHDPFRSILATGFAGTGGVWITKEALNTSKTPAWIKLGTVSGTTEELAWSEDGDILYVGTNTGSLFRFSNINAVKDSANGDVSSAGTVVVKTQIAGFGRSILGISVDPVNSEKVAVVLGNYGSTTYVYYSTTAATCASSVALTNFSPKQGTGTSKLPSMPVYSVIIEKVNPNRVIVATEHGIFSTDDITQTNPVWSAENGSTTQFPLVATYDIRQQRRDGTVVNNPNVIYAGTHGRGIWKSSTLIGPVTVGVNEPINTNSSYSFQSSLNVYPNPMNDLGTVSFDLAESTTISVSIFNLQGKLIKTINAGRLQKGNQKVQINTETLSKGTYLISVDGANVHATSRFVVVK